MFWDIFLSSCGLILGILVVGTVLSLVMSNKKVD